ncbi:MAG: hypothetical protein ABL957_11420 [Parvularculaceae bacterium]
MQTLDLKAATVTNEEIGEGLSAAWEEGSAELLVAFSGFATRYRPWESFHFMGLTRKYPVNKLFFRDTKQAWYHQGVPGVSTNVDETAAYIASVIAERSVKRTVAIGVSAGGYAALIHGWLLEVDEVHAIAPQSYIDVDNRLANDDFFMDEQVANIYETDRAQQEYFDLVPLFTNGQNTRTQFHIHYCRNHRLDTLHALRLKDAPNVTLHDYEEGGHRLTPRLTKDGTLDRAIETALDVRPDPARAGRGGAEQ